LKPVCSSDFAPKIRVKPRAGERFSKEARSGRNWTLKRCWASPMPMETARKATSMPPTGSRPSRAIAIASDFASMPRPAIAAITSAERATMPLAAHAARGREARSAIHPPSA